MFEWFDELEKLAAKQEGFEGFVHGLRLARKGASAAAIDSAERSLGIRLPPSYRAFLARWDGSDPASGSHRFLSVAELLEKASDAEAPFRPFAKRATRAGDVAPRCDDYYADKPAHWLFFCKFALGSDGWCFDTSSPNPEFPVWPYDAGDANWSAPGLYEPETTIMWHVSFEDAFLTQLYESCLDDRAWRAYEGWPAMEALVRKVSARLGSEVPWEFRASRRPAA